MKKILCLFLVLLCGKIVVAQNGTIDWAVDLTFIKNELPQKHYGEIKYLTLPSSKLKVSYSTKFFNHYQPDTDAFYPDIEIETSFDDYRMGIDPVFEYIREH